MNGKTVRKEVIMNNYTMNVTGVTKRYIFYNDNRTIKATPEALREIMDAAKADAHFYRRMYKELDQMFAKAKLNLDYGTHGGNYFERVGKISGIADAMKEANKKKLHAIQIETQCINALGIE